MPLSTQQTNVPDNFTPTFQQKDEEINRLSSLFPELNNFPEETRKKIKEFLLFFKDILFTETELEIYLDTDAGGDVDDLLAAILMSYLAEKNSKIKVKFITNHFATKEKAAGLKVTLENLGFKNLDISAGYGVEWSDALIEEFQEWLTKDKDDSTKNDEAIKLFNKFKTEFRNENPYFPTFMGIPVPKELAESPALNQNDVTKTYAQQIGGHFGPIKTAYPDAFSQEELDKIRNKEKAIDELIQSATNHSPQNPLKYIAIGSLINLAEAIKKDPSIAENIELVCMGGLPPKGYNFLINPKYLAEVLKAGVKVRVVGPGFVSPNNELKILSNNEYQTYNLELSTLIKNSLLKSITASELFSEFEKLVKEADPNSEEAKLLKETSKLTIEKLEEVLEKKATLSVEQKTQIKEIKEKRKNLKGQQLSDIGEILLNYAAGWSRIDWRKQESKGGPLICDPITTALALFWNETNESITIKKTSVVFPCFDKDSFKPETPLAFTKEAENLVTNALNAKEAIGYNLPAQFPTMRETTLQDEKEGTPIFPLYFVDKINNQELALYEGMQVLYRYVFSKDFLCRHTPELKNTNDDKSDQNAMNDNDDENTYQNHPTPTCTY